MMPRRKAPPRALIFLSLAAMALALAACGGKPSSGEPAAEAAAGNAEKKAAPLMEARQTNVESVTLQPRDLTLERTYVGYLLPNQRVQLPSEIEGVVDKVFFEEGDPVKAGQVLANVSTRQLTIRRDLAKSNLELAQANFKRETQMRTSNLIPQSQLDATRNQLEVAKFSLDLAQLELTKSVIRSPFQGYVKTQGLKAGEFARKGGLVAEVLDTSRLRVLVNIPEGEIGDFTVGKAVSISLTALPGKTYTGTVKTVGLEADQKNRSFPVEVDLPNPTGELRPGMLARATINVGHFANQVIIPRYAILERENSRVVYVDGGGVAQERTIRAGASRNGEVQVLEGLQAGDALIVKGQQQLTPEAPIKVRKTSLQSDEIMGKNEPQ